MYFKIGFLLTNLLIGSYANVDMALFFDHTDTRSRIVGGKLAGRVPHMVALTYGTDFRNLLCGGSLITTSYVLTAAHCIHPIINDEGSLISSLLGHVDTNQYAYGGTTYSFSRGIIHPRYDENYVKNDMGFLVTSSVVELRDTVSVVPLTFRFIEAGLKTTVHGWGRSSTGGPVSEDLLELNATVMDGEECKANIATRTIVPVNPEIEICTYTYERAGVCNGDSGSALLDRETKEQIGVVSWGIPCAQGFPDMFARVSAFNNWIISTVPDINE